MAIKLDTKSLFRLNWKFIQKYFIGFDLSKKWTNWIIECIKTTSFSVLVIGIPREPVSQRELLGRGVLALRMLLLFVLNTYAFIIHFMANVRISGIGKEVSENCLLNPYLMFTDYCMISCKAKKTTARHVTTILKNYYNVLGQLVNNHK